jgi:hypothetical protein
MQRTIVLNPIEPAPLSIRTALGAALDLGLTFIGQNKAPVDPTTLLPQLVLLPRSRGGIFAYPVETTSSEGGTGTVTVPSTVLVDRSGYTLELYSRRTAVNPADPPVATGLIAKGVVRLDGEAFQSWGPLGTINTPVVVGPTGPQGIQGMQGVQGETGQRGSVWRSAPGAPTTLPEDLPNDMYLDETSGDVYRFEAATGWVRQ